MKTKQEHSYEDYEIKSTLTRERYYRDSAQWVKLRESYHPDAGRTLIKVSWFEGNADEFVAASKKMAAAGTVASHLYLPMEVHFSNDRSRAVSEATGNVTIRFPFEEHMYELVSYTRFISKLEKVGDDWKILTLEPIYDRDTIVPVTPVAPTLTNGPMPTFTKGTRESYRCLAWVLDLRGYKVDMELAGTDRPETVEKLMESYFEWLRG